MTTNIDPKNVPTIGDQVAKLTTQLHRDIRSSIRYHKEQLAEKIAAIEQNRQAVPTLMAAGFDPQMRSYHEPFESVFVHLGNAFGGKGKKKLVEQQKKEIAKVLGCHLEEESKSLANGRKRIVEVTLKPSKFPNLQIIYHDQIPEEGGRCKVVKTTRKTRGNVSYSLECSVK